MLGRLQPFFSGNLARLQPIINRPLWSGCKSFLRGNRARPSLAALESGRPRSRVLLHAASTPRSRMTLRRSFPGFEHRGLGRSYFLRQPSGAVLGVVDEGNTQGKSGHWHTERRRLPKEIRRKSPIPDKREAATKKSPARGGASSWNETFRSRWRGRLTSCRPCRPYHPCQASAAPLLPSARH